LLEVAEQDHIICQLAVELAVLVVAVAELVIMDRHYGQVIQVLTKG
jgi:hypothetical protein